MPSRAADQIVIDTLGKLCTHGHGMGGCCLTCQRVFAVSLPALIKERGGDRRAVGMKPLRCPGCQGRRTSFQIAASRRVGRRPPAILGYPIARRAPDR
jgi:hypothetical protein